MNGKINEKQRKKRKKNGRKKKGGEKFLISDSGSWHRLVLSLPVLCINFVFFDVMKNPISKVNHLSEIVNHQWSINFDRNVSP